MNQKTIKTKISRISVSGYKVLKGQCIILNLRCYCVHFAGKLGKDIKVIDSKQVIIDVLGIVNGENL